MGYCTYDFTESMRIAGVKLEDVEHVLAGWGNVDAEGACCEECGGEWSGGFIFQTTDGRVGKVEGWCDYTGWGCQDGADVEWMEPGAGLFPIPNGADIDPADLNGEQLLQLIRLVDGAYA